MGRSIRTRLKDLLPVIYLPVALCITWPSITVLSNNVLGRMGGDNYEHVWYLWWLGTTLFDNIIGDPANITVLNHPHGIESPLNLTHTPALLLPAVIGWLTNPVVAYNVAMIIIPSVNALGMYWLTKELTCNQWAAFVGGLLFGFSPYVFGHMQAGHLSQISMLGFPLFALFLLRLLNTNAWYYAVLTGVASFISAAHPTHLPYFLLPTTAVIIWFKRNKLRNKSVVLHCGAAAVLGATLLLPFYLPLINLAGSDQIANSNLINFGDSIGKSMDIASFVTPPYENPFLPNNLHSVAQKMVSTSDETHGYIGFISILLVFTALQLNSRAVSPWTTLAIITLILSLGPVLKFAGEIVSINVDNTQYPLQLPYTILAQIPILEWSRTPARFFATTHFAISIIASYGMSAILQRNQKSQWWRFVIITSISIIALSERIIAWPFPTSHAWNTAPIRQLQSSNDGGTVLNIPPSFTTNNIALYSQTIHKLPIIGGQIFRSSDQNVTTSKFFNSLLQVKSETDITPEPTDEAIFYVLDAYNIKNIVNHHWAENYNPLQHDYLIDMFGTPTATSIIDSLYSIPTKSSELPKVIITLEHDEWHESEIWGNKPTRWFADSTTIYIYSAYAQSGQLEFDVIPGQQLHYIDLSVNRKPLTTLIVGDTATYSTPTIDLVPGITVIRLMDRYGAETVVGDLRCIGANPFAGKLKINLECDPHIKGQRTVSIGIQNMNWVSDPSEKPILANFGNQIGLTSAKIPEIISAEDKLIIPLNFQSLDNIIHDMVIFVHIFNIDKSFDPDNVTLISQWDGWPLQGQFQTTTWKTGEQLGFNITIPIPKDSPKGNYLVHLGWYKTETQVRLPIASTTYETRDSVLKLGSFKLLK